jgi:hypothetical protein
MDPPVLGVGLLHHVVAGLIGLDGNHLQHVVTIETLVSYVH